MSASGTGSPSTKIIEAGRRRHRHADEFGEQAVELRASRGSAAGASRLADVVIELAGRIGCGTCSSVASPASSPSRLSRVNSGAELPSGLNW